MDIELRSANSSAESTVSLRNDSIHIFGGFVNGERGGVFIRGPVAMATGQIIGFIVILFYQQHARRLQSTVRLPW